MSRRRRIPRKWPTTELPITKLLIKVVCSDRGTHPDQLFTTAEVWSSGEVSFDDNAPSPFSVRGLANDPHSTYKFVCRACKQPFSLRRDTIEHRTAILMAHNRDRWDLSAVVRWPTLPK